MIILIYGLPGAGKTALAEELVARTGAIHLNADAVRADLSSDLGFTIADRLEQARRLGAIARLISSQGKICIVDFICPTKETRKMFGKADFTFWASRVYEGHYEDTNRMWEDPSKDEYDIKINLGLTVKQEADLCFDFMEIPCWKTPTTLMLGRYQPWHAGHMALYDEARKRGNQVVIGVRDTGGTSEKDPFEYAKVKELILESMPTAFVMMMPNITHIVYGRDVGYKIEKVELGQDIEAISATQKRAEMGI
jgi:adenylylsulfate kinase